MANTPTEARIMRQWLIGLAFLLMLAGPATAQQTFGITPSNTSTQSMSVSTSSSSITLDSKSGTSVVIFNTGASTAYITNTATATTTGFPLPGGTGAVFNFQPGSVVSAITSANTTTLLVGKGSGPTALAGAGGQGSASNPTLIDCSAVNNLLCTGIYAPIPAGTNTIGNAGSLAYPVGATPYTASATGTTGATAATLAGAASVTTYICGFSIRANATAAATGNSTVAGTISGTLNFTQWTAPLASGIGITEMIFPQCIPASATNTSIVVTSAAPGSGGVVSVSAWGYKL